MVRVLPRPATREQDRPPTWIAAGRAALAAASPPLVMAALLVSAWAVYVRLSGVRPYLVPSPAMVWRRWWGDLPFFFGEGLTTLSEAMGGLAIGAGLAFALAVPLAHSRRLERSVLPLAIALKVTPIVAIAPLFTIWFGFGYTPKVLIAALVSFFPVLINTITGLRDVQPSLLDVFRSVDASHWTVFRRLRLPCALPYLFAAVRVSTTLALIGALVAEWSNAAGGLGRVIWLANSNLDTATLFAAIFTLALIGIALNTALAMLERRVLFWHAAYR